MVEDKKVVRHKAQSLVLENRQKLSLLGVRAVDSFNDEIVIIDTELGLLVVRGQTLKIQKLNLENAELNIEGNICSCEYSENSDSSRSKSGFFSKIFK